jgi:hypothetical protein
VLPDTTTTAATTTSTTTAAANTTENPLKCQLSASCLQERLPGGRSRLGPPVLRRGLRGGHTPQRDIYTQCVCIRIDIPLLFTASRRWPYPFNTVCSPLDNVPGRSCIYTAVYMGLPGTYLDSVSASIATSVPAYVPYNQRSGIKLTQ